MALAGDHTRVTVYQTTKDHPIHQVFSSSFSKYDYPALKAIDLDNAEQGHEYLGCGVSLTDASCWLMSRMNSSKRKLIYDMAFSKSGANLSMIRLNCGSSDYATELYNYNEQAGDVKMKHFSIDHDREYMIPIIKEVKDYRPDAYVFSAIWSVPGWMKTEGNMIGGHQSDKYLEAVAEYWGKYLDEYRKEGIDIQAISAQNEPETDQMNGAPATLLSAEQESDLITRHFPKVFKRYGLKPQIWLLDHNYSRYERVRSQLQNPDVRKNISAIAWHPYGGSPDKASEIFSEYPEIAMHLTERGPNMAMTDIQTCVWWCDVIFNALNAGCSSFTSWNLVLDENGSPNVGKSPCAGLFTEDSTTGEISTCTQFEVFRQFCPYVERGAKILKVSGPKENWLRSIVFKNPDGSYVIVLCDDGTNNSQADRDRVLIKFKGKYLHLPLPIRTWSMTTVVIRNDSES